LGAAPFVMFFAALPLAWVWRHAIATDTRESTAEHGSATSRATSMVMWTERTSDQGSLGPGTRALAAATVVLPIVVIGWLTIHDYFWTWRHDALKRLVYSQQITSASLYMETLPPDAYVYFYSERNPFSLETRQFLAPDVEGEDRSSEFSGGGGSIDGINRSRRAVFVLLGAYLPLLSEIESRYPGGEERIGRDDGPVGL